MTSTMRERRAGKFGRIVLCLACVAAVMAFWLGRDQTQWQFDRGLRALETADVATFKNAVERLHDGRASTEVGVLHAGYLARAGDYSAALAGLARLDLNHASDAVRIPALMIAGECLYKSGEIAEAERVFRLVAHEHPDAVKAHRWLATVYHELGAMDYSLAALEQVMRLEPDDFFAYRLAGTIHNLDKGDYGLAVENYRLALERSPPEEHRRSIVTELARCLIELRDYGAALELLSPEVADPIVLALRAECLWAQADWTHARELLDRAEALSPESVPVRVLRARMHLDEGRTEEAIAVLRRLVEDEPHDFRSRYQLALAYQRRGDTVAARAEMERVNESKPLRTRLHDLYTEAMSAPDDAAVRYEIADLCDQLGQQALAAKWRDLARACQSARVPLFPQER